MQREVSINALVLTIVVTQAVYKYSKNATSLVSPPFFYFLPVVFSYFISTAFRMDRLKKAFLTVFGQDQLVT